MAAEKPLTMNIRPVSTDCDTFICRRMKNKAHPAKSTAPVYLLPTRSMRHILIGKPEENKTIILVGCTIKSTLVVYTILSISKVIKTNNLSHKIVKSNWIIFSWYIDSLHVIRNNLSDYNLLTNKFSKCGYNHGNIIIWL